MKNQRAVLVLVLVVVLGGALWWYLGQTTLPVPLAQAPVLQDSAKQPAPQKAQVQPANQVKATLRIFEGDSPLQPLQATFEVDAIVSQSEISSYVVAFGDGATSTLTLQCKGGIGGQAYCGGASTYHIYEKAGAYEAKLIANGTVVDTQTITLKAPAVISALPDSGQAPLLVTFIPAFMGMGYHYIEFGDGTKADATCAEFVTNTDRCVRMNNISHTYTAPGTYTVKYQEELGTTQTVGSVVITVQ